VVDFLVKDTIRKYPVETCPYCGEAALPQDPKVSMCSSCKPLMFSLELRWPVQLTFV
jgi:hypothetical protein